MVVVRFVKIKFFHDINKNIYLLIFYFIYIFNSQTEISSSAQTCLNREQSAIQRSSVFMTWTNCLLLCFALSYCLSRIDPLQAFTNTHIRLHIIDLILIDEHGESLLGLFYLKWSNNRTHILLVKLTNWYRN